MAVTRTTGNINEKKTSKLKLLNYMKQDYKHGAHKFESNSNKIQTYY